MAIHSQRQPQSAFHMWSPRRKPAGALWGERQLLRGGTGSKSIVLALQAATSTCVATFTDGASIQAAALLRPNSLNHAFAIAVREVCRYITSVDHFDDFSVNDRLMLFRSCQCVA